MSEATDALEHFTMATTLRELDAFHDFAVHQISNGGPSLTLAELVDLWQVENPTPAEQQDVLASLERAQAQLDAGQGRPVAELNAELRKQYGFAKP